MKYNFCILNKLFILSLLVFIANGSKYGPIFIDDENKIQLEWRVNGNDTFMLLLNASTTSWVALGWTNVDYTNSSNNENRFDYVVAEYYNDNGYRTCRVSDMFSPDRIMSTKINVDETYGGRNNLLATCYQDTNLNYSSFTFTREFKTGDLKGDVDFPEDGQVLFYWRLGQGNSYTQDSPYMMGAKLVTIEEVESSRMKEIDYFSYHSSFMFATFALIMPFAIFIARYLRITHTWWFPVHIILQVAGMIFTFIGIYMGYKIARGVNITSKHAVLGVVTLCLFYISIILGATSHFAWNPKRTSTPIFPDIIHWLGGHLTLVFGLTTIILGMLLANVSIGMVIVFGISFFILLTAILTIEFYRWKYPDHEKTGLIKMMDKLNK